MFFKRSLSILSLVIATLAFPVMLGAQEADSSVHNLSDEYLPADTALSPEEDEDYEVQPVTNESARYFVAKYLQPNGGGPDSIQYRAYPDSQLQRIKKDGAFWYVNYPFTRKEPATGNNKPAFRDRERPTGFYSFLQTLMWFVIVGAFAAFLIIYLSNSNVKLFRSRNRLIGTDEGQEPETENIFEINYQKEIEKAESKGNYRYAVRLMFLRLLKTMADRNIIQYLPDRTNFDYLVQLQPTRYYHDFFRLTRNYEYCWYGQFDVDNSKYQLLTQDFNSFDNKLRV